MKFAIHLILLLTFSAALPLASAAPRIAIAGISHETNSFNLTKAKLADFEGEDALSGNRKEWLETNAKTNQNAAGMIAGAKEYGLELFPIHFFSAVPRGPIDTQGFNTMVERVIQRLKQAPGYDGVLLVLHGAMVATGFPAEEPRSAGVSGQAWGRSFQLQSPMTFTPT